MKILISTFSEGDAEKIQRVMRLLPYERLVLVGRAGEESSADFKTISRLEEMAGERTVATIGATSAGSRTVASSGRTAAASPTGAAARRSCRAASSTCCPTGSAF